MFCAKKRAGVKVSILRAYCPNFFVLAVVQKLFCIMNMLFGLHEMAILCNTEVTVK